MTAAELLRSLDKAATARPWKCVDDVYGGQEELYCEFSKVGPFDVVGGRAGDNGLCASVTRNLLPELAALVDAVEKWVLTGRETDEYIVIVAYNTLNAKATELEAK